MVEVPERVGRFSLTTQETGDGTIVLRVAGDVDVSVAEQLQAVGIGLLISDECSRLVIDLAEVPFLDSTGLGALIALRNVAEASVRTLALQRPSPRVVRLLTITGVSGVFELIDQ